MRLSSQRSVADSFSSMPLEPLGAGTDLNLQDGSRVAVIGGGPAGSLFTYFLLRMAEEIDLELEVDIFEPRFFSRSGPSGCNHCGGIVSESLVQILAAEGINLPAEVVQRGIESYVVHMDVGSVAIQSPAKESRIAALYRGNGPREGGDLQWESFDAYLQGLAVEKGAKVRHKLVTGVDWEGGQPRLTEIANHSGRPTTLLPVAAGVNSNFIKLLDDSPQDSSHQSLPAAISASSNLLQDGKCEDPRELGARVPAGYTELRVRRHDSKGTLSLPL